MAKQTSVLILGGTGAIGTYLVPQLLGMGCVVDVTTRSEHSSSCKGLNYIVGDAQDDTFLQQLLGDGGYDIVVDFMIYSTDRFLERSDLLLSQCGRYVYLSSYRVFADTDVINESSPRLLDVIKDEEFLGTDEYALAKARQEDVLRNSGRNNWTIIRPSITYSSDRFQFGTMEKDVFIWRSVNNLPTPIPAEIDGKQVTLTWAGDTARQMAKLILNPETIGEDYNIGTREHHTWLEIVSIYRRRINLVVKKVKMRNYLRAMGNGINDEYLIKYNRCYDRVFDNTKTLAAVGETQSDMMLLGDGLPKELDTFLRRPSYSVNYQTQARFDKATGSSVNKSGLDAASRDLYDRARHPLMYALRSTLRLRTRLRQLKRALRVRTRVRKIISMVKFRLERWKYRDVEGAIVTLSGYYNYGNILQRFALQKFLSNNNHKFVSYWNEQGHGRTDTEESVQFTREFVKRNIFLKDFSSKDGFSTYITGSDQVWRNWGYEDPKKELGYYFFDFAQNPKTKRIAYAASVGQDSLEDAHINSDTAEYLGPLAKNMHAVGMRETSGVDLVRREWGVEARDVIDPTMLLDRSEYSRLIDESPYDLQDASGTIFTYFILSNISKRAFVDMVLEKKGLKENSIYLEDKDILPPVEAWLKGIRDAELVVADSFHGIVFSIIFNTPFIVVESGTGGSARLTTLLEKFGLGDRYITSNQAEEYDIAKLYDIDWRDVNTRLEKLRDLDGGWLLSVIEGDAEV